MFFLNSNTLNAQNVVFDHVIQQKDDIQTFALANSENFLFTNIYQTESDFHSYLYRIDVYTKLVDSVIITDAPEKAFLATDIHVVDSTIIMLGNYYSWLTANTMRTQAIFICDLNLNLLDSISFGPTGVTIRQGEVINETIFTYPLQINFSPYAPKVMKIVMNPLQIVDSMFISSNLINGVENSLGFDSTSNSLVIFGEQGEIVKIDTASFQIDTSFIPAGLSFFFPLGISDNLETSQNRILIQSPKHPAIFLLDKQYQLVDTIKLDRNQRIANERYVYGSHVLLNDSLLVVGTTYALINPNSTVKRDTLVFYGLTKNGQQLWRKEYFNGQHFFLFHMVSVNNYIYALARHRNLDEPNSKVKVVVLKMNTSGELLDEIELVSINLTQISIYPNPAKEFVIIESKVGNPEVQAIYSSNGKKMKVHQDVDRINTSNLTSGIYTFQVILNEQVFFQKVVVQ